MYELKQPWRHCQHRGGRVERPAASLRFLISTAPMETGGKGIRRNESLSAELPLDIGKLAPRGACGRIPVGPVSGGGLLVSVFTHLSASNWKTGRRTAQIMTPVNEMSHGCLCIVNRTAVKRITPGALNTALCSNTSSYSLLMQHILYATPEWANEERKYQCTNWYTDRSD